MVARIQKKKETRYLRQIEWKAIQLSNFVKDSVDGREDEILKYLYVSMVALCGFMVWWIGVLPASWLVGHSELHSKLLQKYFFSPATEGLLSSQVVLKFKGHLAVQMTHILPGLLWSIALPIQFHPTIRKKYRKSHRVLGYVFVVTVLMMAMGVGIILYRRLTFPYDYPELLSVSGGVSRIHCSLFLASCWFVSTALIAIWKAREKKFNEHQRYMIRHVGSGIWIAIQRVIVLVAYVGAPYSRKSQRDMFEISAMASLTISIGAGEFAIWLLDRKERLSKRH